MNTEGNQLLGGKAEVQKKLCFRAAHNMAKILPYEANVRERLGELFQKILEKKFEADGKFL